MQKHYPFIKCQAAGNDFVLFEISKTETFTKELCAQICHRKYGIGADGVIFASGDLPNLNMTYVNSDGAEADLCGNALRALTGVMQQSLQITTNRGVYTTIYDGSYHGLKLQNATTICDDVVIHVHGQRIRGMWVDTGVDHFVTEVDDIEHFQLFKIAPAVRYHPSFQPTGVNVNVVKIEADTIFMRTYEKGVEQETYSCGTGAHAAYEYVLAKYQRSIKTVVFAFSHEKIVIEKCKGGLIAQGPSKVVFRGVLDLDDFDIETVQRSNKLQNTILTV